MVDTGEIQAYKGIHNMSEEHQSSGKELTIEPLRYREDVINAAIGVKRLTNEAVAQKAGVNFKTVSAIRNGDPNVRLVSLHAVVTALGLTLREVFEPRPEEEKEETIA